MNKILIHKGDCTIFADNKKFLTFNIKTNLNLKGWTAKFVLGWITKEITDISSKIFEVILDANETNQLRLGKQFGTIILTDADGNIKTIVNTIPFEVTTAVVENEYQEVDLSIPQSSGVDLTLRVGSVGGGSGVTSYELLTDLPSINDVELIGNKTLEELGIQPIGDYLTSIPQEYVTETELNAKGYLTEHQDISNLATKDEIPSVEGLVTEKQLTDGLATKQPVGDYALKADIPSVDNFVTRDEFNSSLADIETLLSEV